jgi:ubiquinone/menaquinone biosynthesis C-methylase UbiE
MNHFASRDAARLYARGRPYFHEQVIARAAELLTLSEPVDAAVDVGCGTGLSTRALRSIARRVVGVDVSEEMIAAAEPMEGVEYRVGPGEALPLPDNAFDLLTISSAYHWLDPERFLSEVCRVLHTGGAFVVYENGFTGMMLEIPAFSGWIQQVHLARYPSPPRRTAFTATDTWPAGFTLVATERYQNTVPMTAAQLADYLLTQSNAIAVVESGKETWEQTRAFLETEIAPYFMDAPDGKRTLQFTGVLWILRKDDAPYG